jgi:hypothetical protein
MDSSICACGVPAPFVLYPSGQGLCGGCLMRRGELMRVRSMIGPQTEVVSDGHDWATVELRRLRGELPAPPEPSREGSERDEQG